MMRDDYDADGMSRFAFVLVSMIKRHKGYRGWAYGMATRMDMRFRASLIIGGKYCTKEFVEFDGVH